MALLTFPIRPAAWQKFFRPVFAHMAVGAGIGAGASYLRGDGSMLRDAAIGAAGGFALGKGLHRSFLRGAEAGGLRGGYNAARSTVRRGMEHANRIPKGAIYSEGQWLNPESGANVFTGKVNDAFRKSMGNVTGKAARKKK